MTYSRRSGGIRFLPTFISGVLLVGSAFGLGVLFATGAGASRGDWLSFAGALLGAAITITGSIGVRAVIARLPDSAELMTAASSL